MSFVPFDGCPNLSGPVCRTDTADRCALRAPWGPVGCPVAVSSLQHALKLGHNRKICVIDSTVVARMQVLRPTDDWQRVFHRSADTSWNVLATIPVVLKNLVIRFH